MEYLCDDVFIVKQVDPEGRKFDKVSRIICDSENYDLSITLDIASELYVLNQKDRFHFVLSSSLTPKSSDPKSGSATFSTSLPEGFYDPELSLPPSARTRLGTTLADKFEYVMYGKIYKAEEASPNSGLMSVFVSFGGLLLKLKGDPKHWRGLVLGSFIYLLIKKMP